MKILNLIKDKPADNFISDGQSSCAYGDLPGIFTQLEEMFAGVEIDPRDCIALSCDNKLLEALALLFLLNRGQGCILWPGNATSPDNEAAELPQFCRYLVAAKHTGSRATSEDLKPWNTRYSFEQNRNWQRLPEIDCRNRVYVCTSGTTGRPRMAVYRFEKLVHNAQCCVERFALNYDDRVAIAVPIFHMYGFGAAFLAAVLAGASIDLQADTNFIRFMERENTFHPTVAYLSPGFCHNITRVRKSERLYRITVVAGDATAEETFLKYERRHGCLINLYGCTELGAVMSGSPEDSLELRSRTAGRPMSGVRLCDKDGEPYTSNNPDAIVELCFIHPCASEGYADEIGQPASDGDTYQPGFYRLKDLGRVSAQGCIQILGRSDHSVNRNGILERFSDLENALIKVEGVETVSVIAGEDTPRGPALIAFCVMREGCMPDERAFKRACHAHLARHSIPDRVIFLDRMPRLSSGKVDRRALEKTL